MANNLKIQFSYEDETTRTYSFGIAESLMPAVKAKIRNINESLDAGTDDGMAAFFVSNSGASLALISGATLEAVTVTDLNILE